MKQTVGELIRHVWQPPLESYSAPHAQVIDPVKQAYNQGWNDAMSYKKDRGLK